MTNASKEKRISISEATSSLIKAVLKMPGDEIIALLNEIEGNMPENKNETRVDYCNEVVFSVDEKFYTGYIANINARGMQIETKNEFQSGQKLTLSFQLPNDSEYVKLTGKIISISEEGVDVLFDVSIEEPLGIPPEKTIMPALDENYC